MQKRIKAFGRWLRRKAPSAIKALLAAVLLIILLAGAYLLLWQLPKHVAYQVHVLEKRLEIENNVRATLAQIVLGLGIFVGLYLTYRRIKATERQAKAAEDGQLTERFTRAIEQLGTQGAKHTAIRLGGIYALERIMRDSEHDAPTVQEVLAAFVRDESVARWQKQASTKSPSSEPLSKSERYPRAENVLKEPSFRISDHTDLQAALTVLGRNPIEHQQIDLQEAHLEHANLQEANLQGSELGRTHLEGAYLLEAHLDGAHLRRAHLEHAILIGAYLQGASLNEADLQGAFLLEAHLERASLFGANLRGAQLQNAHMEHANLRQAHLDDADLEGADLTGADVRGTILEMTEGDDKEAG